MSTVSLRPPNTKAGSYYKSGAFIEKVAAVSTEGILNSVMAVNKNASTVYIYVYDNTAASGTQLCPPIPVPAGQAVTLDLTYGLPFTNGVYVAASSTLATYGALGANDVNYMVGYQKTVGA